MSKIVKGIRYFLRADWNLKKNILHILWLSIKITLMVRYVPLRYYYNRYFTELQDSEFNLQPFRGEISFIKRILMHLPWHITCLMESLIIKEYLLQYGINLHVTIGIRKIVKLEAHAWYGLSRSNGFLELLMYAYNEDE